MAGRLVEQLVDVGLVTEAQAQTSDAGEPGLPSSQVVRNLVAAGLDERALAGFFVSLGFGPMLQSQELARADGDLVRRLPGVDAHDLCAMPLQPSPAGAVVAMADPTDERAVARLSDALGGSILPTVAKLSDLLASIDRAYPPERPSLDNDPLALARSRPPSGVVPLVQAKAEIGSDQTLSAFDPSLSELASTPSPVWDRAWNKTRPERESSLTPKANHIPLPSLTTSLTPHAFAPPPITPRPSNATPASTSVSSARTKVSRTRMELSSRGSTCAPRVCRSIGCKIFSHGCRAPVAW